MAIIQISKIQQRSGLLVDLPQLDEAQLGWANDAKRLFIGATGNTTTNVENVEVLTSYSTISFSQVEGSDGSNVNISNVLPGQILAYDSSINSWVNTGGNANAPGNTSQYSGIPIHLGTVSNIKIGGGADGYILETDGAGNVSWTSKGTLRTTIIGLSNATPVVMTVANTVPYTNGLEITITGANTPNSNVVNGQTFYIQLDANFTANSNVVGSGNVSLFTSSDFANANAVVGTGFVYVANSGVATASLAGGSASTPGGGNTQIQFNDGGILNGSSAFTLTSANGLTTVSLTGNFSASNVAGGNLVTANYLTGTLTTNAQPNITSVGSLASLSVVGNANVGNIGTAIITATGNITGANLITGGVISVTGNANIGNIGTAGLITATGNITGGNLITSGVISATGNANVGNIGATGVISTTLSATGNANIGNIGTAGLITATGNIQGGNLITSGDISATGNANVGNIGATGVISTTVSATGNGTFGNIDGGNLVTANNITITGISDLGSNANVRITGGTEYQVLLTADNSGAGNLAWGTILFDRLDNGTSNVVVAPDGNVTTSVGGVADVLTVTGTGLVVAGNIVPSLDIQYDLGNTTNRWHDLYLSGNTIYIGTSTITANTTGVTINTPNAAPVALKPAGANAQVQYNDDGAFGGNPAFVFDEGNTRLTANNFVATSTANLGAVGNLTITGGSNGQVLTTNGSNVLSWTTVSGGNGSSYGDSNVVTLLGSFGSNSVSTTGNITAGNITARYLLNSVETGISANGSNASTATALGNTINIVSTVASGTGVKLPSAIAGMTIYITNINANSLTVYPASGAINSAAANFVQPANSTIHYIASSTTQWYTVGATYA